MCLIFMKIILQKIYLSSVLSCESWGQTLAIQTRNKTNENNKVASLVTPHLNCAGEGCAHLNASLNNI